MNDEDDGRGNGDDGDDGVGMCQRKIKMISETISISRTSCGAVS